MAKFISALYPQKKNLDLSMGAAGSVLIDKSMTTSRGLLLLILMLFFCFSSSLKAAVSSAVGSAPEQPKSVRGVLLL